MNKLLTLVFAWGWLTLPVFGQTHPASASSEYLFRFVPGRDMFYVPWSGNGEELDRLLACIAEHKTAILEGEIPVEVHGYSISQATAAENLATAKLRSNRVKSEMILRGGLTEACFRTRNHPSDGNYVTVRITLPAAEPAEPAEQPEPAARPAGPAGPAEPAGKAETAPQPAEPAAEEQPAANPAPAGETTAEEVPPVLEEARSDAETHHMPEADRPKGCATSLALRANLLRWATLTPDLGLEWRITRSLGIAVNGSWTSWTWSGVDRRYALWEVAPEVRWYLGERKRGYLGAMFKTGQFNYKLSDTGRQGDLTGGGLTGGYQLPLCRNLMMDFSLGMGYLNADFETYTVIDGVRVRQGAENRNWWGPINAGVSLVWKLF